MKNIITKFNNFIFELFDYKNYQKEEDVWNLVSYTFIINDNTYRVMFNKMDTFKNDYHLSFCLFDKNGKEIYLLLNDYKKSFKVLSNVKHITEEFVKSRIVDILVYESLDVEREYIYTKFTQNMVVNNLFKMYFINRNKKSKVFILTNKNDDEYKKYIGDENIFNKIVKKLKEI